MFAFKIQLNGKRLCTAGIGEAGVVSANITWVANEATTQQAGLKAVSSEHASIRVGGLISSTEEHVVWARRDLAEGDEIVIRVVNSPRADQPRERKRDTAAQIRTRQKQQVRRLAKSFGWKITTK